MSDSQGRHWKRYLTVIPWTFGVLFILSGLALTLTPESDLLRSVSSGILMIAVGLFAVPSVRRKISTLTTGRGDGQVVWASCCGRDSQAVSGTPQPLRLC